MPSLSAPLASYLLNVLWLVPLAGAAGALAARLVRRLGFLIRHRIWATTLLIAALLPALPLALHSLPDRPVSGRVLAHTGPFPTVSFPSATNAAGVLSSRSLHLIATYYALILLGFCLRFAHALASTARLLRESAPLTLPPTFEGVVQACQTSFGVAPELRLSRRLLGPVTFSFARPVLLLPVAFPENTSPADFHAALAHEFAHIVRRDFAKNLLFELLSLPIAFHPVTWLLKAKLAHTRELVCDHVAARHAGDDSHAYVQSLLRLATGMAALAQAQPFPSIGLFDGNTLELRVMELKAVSPSTSLIRRCSLFAAAAFCLLVPSVIAAAAPPLSGATGSSAESPAGEVYRPGKEVSAPILIKQVEPEYPAGSQEPGGPVSGSCQLALVVDSSGVPREIHVVRTLTKAFDERAIAAVQQYRFRPGKRFGKPVSVAIMIEVNFQKF